MTGNDESAARALEILKGWQWGRYDPDGCLLSNSYELNRVVNRLAFHGLQRPADAVLKLLSEGKLVAICTYRWLKFQHGRRYEISEYMQQLDASKWLALAKALEAQWGFLRGIECPDPVTTLEKLGIDHCDGAQWEPSYNRCAYAACPPETNTFDPAYFEEWFSAEDIEITLASSEYAITSDSVSMIEDEVSPIETAESIKPSIAEAELVKWWNSKADVRDLLTKDELLALVRAKYPDKHISRDRVRELIGTRKRGPKPFRG